jgi:hypothetical protein
MTQISPFVPLPKDAMPGALLAGAGNGEPATSFAQLLDNADNASRKSHKQPEHPVYGFAELGMFGLHASQVAGDAAPAKESPAHIGASPPVNNNTEASLTVPVAPPRNGASTLIYVPSLEASDRPPVIAAPSPSPQGSGSAAAAPPSRVNANPATARASSNRAAPPALPKNVVPLSTRKSAEPVSVAVTGPDNGLSIAVRSEAAAPPEIVKLRRLIESTVAKFEMDVAELHINGTAPAVSPSFSIGGGMNGGGAR